MNTEVNRAQFLLKINLPSVLLHISFNEILFLFALNKKISDGFVNMPRSASMDKSLEVIKSPENINKFHKRLNNLLEISFSIPLISINLSDDLGLLNELVLVHFNDLLLVATVKHLSVLL